jgi:quinol monooxygenase YgiN
MVDRREFVLISTMWVLGCGLPEISVKGTGTRMYGLIGQILATEGDREELAEILLEGVAGMPGCLSYIVARDSADDNALWVTEVWDSEASHQDSLSLPSVQDAIRKGRPLIAGFGQRFITTPLGGQGLPATDR